MLDEIAGAFRSAIQGQWGTAGFIAAGAIAGIWFVLSLAQRLLPWAINRDTLKHKSQVDSYNRLEERLNQYQDQLIDCRGECSSLQEKIKSRDKIIADQAQEILDLRNRIERIQ